MLCVIMLSVAIRLNIIVLSAIVPNIIVLSNAIMRIIFYDTLFSVTLF
jgi:hypothetical protein